MDDEANVVRKHYETEADEDARLRSGMGRLEYWRVQEIVRRHLADAPRRVLDVGGGSGVHSEWLVADGHTVRLVDLAERHVAIAHERLGHVSTFAASVGNALALPAADNSYDAVLLLGPLYHLQRREDRLAAWREAARVAAPGGLVVAMVITRFASLLDGLAQGYLFEPEFQRIVAADLRDGRHENPSGHPGWFTTAYFHEADEAACEATEAGLEVVETVGVEGPAGWFGELSAHLDDATDRETILESARRVELAPSVLGASPHLVCVARKV